MSRGTTKRGIRMEDELWHEFLAATKTAGENASAVVRGLVREWLSRQRQAGGNMNDGDNCKIKPGTWGLYIHHDCTAHKYDGRPEYIPGTFDSRDKSAK